MGQGRGKLLAGQVLGGPVAVIAMAAALTAAASADIQVCTSAAAPKCSPTGLATDFETGLLYVADTGNNRIDVFKNGGTEAGTQRASEE